VKLPPQLCSGCNRGIYWRKRNGGRAIAIDADSKRITIVTDGGDVVRGYTKHDCRTARERPEDLIEAES